MVKKKPQQDIASRLKEWAETFGGMAGLERKLGKGRNTLTPYVRTENAPKPGADLLVKFAGLGVNLYWLLGVDPDGPMLRSAYVPESKDVEELVVVLRDGKQVSFVPKR